MTLKLLSCKGNVLLFFWGAMQQSCVNYVLCYAKMQWHMKRKQQSCHSRYVPLWSLSKHGCYRCNMTSPFCGQSHMTQWYHAKMILIIIVIIEELSPLLIVLLILWNTIYCALLYFALTGTCVPLFLLLCCELVLTGTVAEISIMCLIKISVNTKRYNLVIDQ